MVTIEKESIVYIFTNLKHGLNGVFVSNFFLFFFSFSIASRRSRMCSLNLLKWIKSLKQKLMRRLVAPAVLVAVIVLPNVELCHRSHDPQDYEPPVVEAPIYAHV